MEVEGWRESGGFWEWDAPVDYDEDDANQIGP